MKKHILILATLGLACTPVAQADTNDVPVNSLLVLAQASTDSSNDPMPSDGSQGNNTPANNNNANSGMSSNNNQSSGNNNYPVQYVVPINPRPFRDRTTVNVEGTTGTSRTGANPEGAGR